MTRTVIQFGEYLQRRRRATIPTSIQLPVLFRAQGKKDVGGEHYGKVFYTLDKYDDTRGFCDVTYLPVEKAVPGLDYGKVMVRMHTTLEMVRGYLNAINDLGILHMVACFGYGPYYTIFHDPNALDGLPPEICFLWSEWEGANGTLKEHAHVLPTAKQIPGAPTLIRE